jgi:hypothetical protein
VISAVATVEHLSCVKLHSDPLQVDVEGHCSVELDGTKSILLDEVALPLQRQRQGISDGTWPTFEH